MENEEYLKQLQRVDSEILNAIQQQLTELTEITFRRAELAEAVAEANRLAERVTEVRENVETLTNAMLFRKSVHIKTDTDELRFDYPHVNISSGVISVKAQVKESTRDWRANRGKVLGRKQGNERLSVED